MFHECLAVHIAISLDLHRASQSDGRDGDHGTPLAPLVSEGEVMNQENDYVLCYSFFDVFDCVLEKHIFLITVKRSTEIAF